MKHFFLAAMLLCLKPLYGETFTTAGLVFKIPSTWTAVATSSPVRKGQWNVPAVKSRDEAGECVVLYFGPALGGDLKTNLNRWLSLVTTPEGNPSHAEPRQRTVGAMKISLIEVYGTYTGVSTLPGVPATPKPGSGLVGAVIEGPEGNVYLRITGPENLVRANLPTFTKILDTVVPAAPVLAPKGTR